jgi:NADH:ubiquinone oxidoreductase subunit D
MQAFPAMCRNGYIADLIATVAMLDPILGGTDR